MHFYPSPLLKTIKNKQTKLLHTCYNTSINADSQQLDTYKQKKYHNIYVIQRKEVDIMVPLFHIINESQNLKYDFISFALFTYLLSYCFTVISINKYFIIIEVFIASIKCSHFLARTFSLQISTFYIAKFMMGMNV